MKHATSSFCVSGRNKFSLGCKFLAILILVLLVSGKSWGQTNPTAQSLPYSQDFASLNTATVTTYPAGWQGWQVTSSAPTSLGSTATPASDKTMSASGAGNSNGNGVYNFTGKLGFLSTGSVDNAIVLAVNTNGKTSISVSFDAMTIRNPYDGSTNNYIEGIVLQYRVGTSGNFTAISYSPSAYQNNTTAQTSGTTGQQIVTGLSATLPATCDNQPVVQIRWIAKTISGSAGSRASFAFDNISVSGSAISCTDPTTQASTVTFSNTLSDQMTVGWTRGGTPGDGVIVVAKAGSAPDDPSDGTAYTANAAFGSGTQINTGTFVVFNGNGTSINITGLSASTTYYFKVYEKNCTGTSIMINTASPAANSQATTAACAVNPTITSTTAISAITPTAASSGAIGLTSGENCAITAKGVCWNTSTAPTIANSKTTDGTGTADFTSSITSLSAQTLYYVRAYATNGFGTAYGPETTFRTLSTELVAHPGTFTATAASNSQINLTFSAASTITNADGYIILRRTGSNPTSTNITDGVAPESLTMPSGTTFVANINSTSTTTYNNTSLPNGNTQYNYAIIAYNWDGTNPETYNYYTSGTIKTVNATTMTTPVTLPYSQDFEGITSEWLLAATGTNKWAIGSATNNGGTKAMYISNDGGTTNAYSVSSTQTGTDAAVRVDLTGQTAASLTFDWKSNGEVGGTGTVYDYGEVYINTGSTDILLSTATEFVNSTTFANRRISLTPYVGSIVTLKFRWVNDNTSGTNPPFAVDNVSITAGDTPAITTTTVSSITINGASTGGIITNDGGSTVTARGVCYGTTTAPTTTGTKTSDGSGTGSFTSTLTGISDNTTYYVRAYATNSTGTAYGNEISFTTSNVSAPVASVATGITSTSFDANWSVITGATNGYLLDVSTNSTFGTSNSATLTESFESGLSSSGYSSSTLTLNSGDWTFNESGLRNTDKNAGTYSCQLKASTGTATTPSLNNVGTVTFYAKASASSTNLVIKKIVNGGTPSTVDTKALTTGWVQYTVAVNDNSSDIKLVFACGSNYTLIDDISIGYTSVSPSFVSGYNAKSISGQSTSSSSVTGLTPNTTYYYRVRAVGRNSTSANSNVITAATLASYNISATSSDEIKGSVSGGGAKDAGVSVSLTATPSSVSYRFVNWTDGSGNFVSVANPYSFTASEDKTLIANFADFTTTISSTVNASTVADCATCNVTVASTGALTIDAAKTYNSITVAPGGKVTVNDGKTLTAPVTLLSDSTGTASFVNYNISSSVTGTVQQYLTGTSSSVIPRGWWYIASPISNAKADVFIPNSSSNKFGYWDEPSFGYPQITDNQTALIQGKGYVFNNNSADGIISFNGTLNNGNIRIQATRTGTTDGARGFNLIGNPYPSYIDWSTVTKNNVRQTIWYRTWAKGGGGMTFDTFDGTVGTANGKRGAVSQYIPPMQGFWVKVNADADTASVIFHNSDRLHREQTAQTNRLRVPGESIMTPAIIRLSVSNGTNSDEAILVGDVNASNAFDNYDSPKMKVNNSEIPELYSIADQQELVINHLNSITNNTELPLGFRPGKTASFTISATEISNLDSNLKVILKDNNTEYELSNGNSYSFSSDATATNNRFSILFKSNGAVTSTENKKVNNIIVSSSNNEISIITDGDSNNNAKATVYNSIGKEVKTLNLKPGINRLSSISTGVYIVQINTNTRTSEHKVVIK